MKSSPLIADSDKRKRLFSFAKERLKPKYKKSTDEDLWKHSLSVAEEVFGLDDADKRYPLGVEIAVLHDIIESGVIDYKGLYQSLQDCGYEHSQAKEIIKSVNILSDVFTKAEFPFLSSKERHQYEAERYIGKDSQTLTVKYADILRNLKGRQKRGPKIVAKYLRKKLPLLDNAPGGDFVLYSKCIAFVNKYIK